MADGHTTDSIPIIPDLQYNEGKPLSPSALTSCKVQPTTDVKKALQTNLTKLLFLAKNEIAPRAWDEPETESTVFRHFLVELQVKLNQIPAKVMKDEVGSDTSAESGLPSEEEQMKDLIVRCGIDRMFENFFGGGVPLGDFVIQEIAKVRCRVLSTETNLAGMMQPQMYPGQQNMHHRPPNMPPNINHLRGPAAGQFIKEQQEMNFMSHPFREAETFCVHQITNQFPNLDKLELPSESTDSSDLPSTSSQPSCPPPKVLFADLAHQWKTQLFCYKLLQDVGVELNVYNIRFFVPQECMFLEGFICFLLQVCAPVFVLNYSVDASELKLFRLTFPEYFVIFLFNFINCRLFMKQIGNALITHKLRKVVSGFDDSLLTKVYIFMDLYANLLNPAVVAVVVNLVLFLSGDVLSAIMNALALNFVVEIDEFFISCTLEDAQKAHARNRAKKMIGFLFGKKEFGSYYQLNESIYDHGDPRGSLVTEVKRMHRLLSIFLIAVFSISYTIAVVLSLYNDGKKT